MTASSDDLAAAATTTRCARRWWPSATISGSRTIKGQKVFKVDGKALRIRQTLIIEDAHGTELYKIQERMLRIKDSMEVEDAQGKQVAMVKKALITPIRERWVVKVKNGPDLEVQGNILDHEYSIGEGRIKWRRYRRSGSDCVIHTAFPSIPVRMTP